MIGLLASLALGAEIEVVVATRDLPVGVAITEEDVFTIPIDERYVPNGVIRSVEYVLGRPPTSPILANEFMREERLATPLDDRHAASVSRGARAISVTVTGGKTSTDHYADVSVMDPEDGPCVVAEQASVLAGWEDAGPREVVVVVELAAALRLSATVSPLTLIPRTIGVERAHPLCTELPED